MTLRTEETLPIWVIRELRIGMYDLSRAVGMGSRALVQGFIFLRISSMWLCLTPVKWSRDGELVTSLLCSFNWGR